MILSATNYFDFLILLALKSIISNLRALVSLVASTPLYKPAVPCWLVSC